MNESSTKENSSIALLLAWLIALLAFVGTLYSSEVMRMPVCHLCWYQRICMYPLVMIFAIALWRNDVRIRIYTLPLCVIGGLFALYQYLEQMIPGFAPINLCGTGINCSAVHFKWLGFITFPFLSLLSFIVIIFLLSVAKQSPRVLQN